MMRWLGFCVLSGMAIFGSVFAITKTVTTPLVTDPSRPLVVDEGSVPLAAQPTTSSTGTRQSLGQQMIVVRDARFVSTTKREIPSERDGKLLVVGTEVAPGDEAKVPGTRLIKNIPVATLAIEVGPNDKLAPEEVLTLGKRPGKKFRRFRPGMDSDNLVPGAVEIAVDFKTFRELQVGDLVKPGQIVALVNPVLAIDELAVKQQKLDINEAERKSSEATKNEYFTRWKLSERLGNAGGASQDDIRMNRLAYDRYGQEEVAKKAGITQAQRELSGAQTVLSMHEIRPAVGGRIKEIYRKTGEAVKNLEPVLQIQDTDRLRVEGLIEIQNSRGIREGMKVIVEPTRPVTPILQLRGHLQDITCVAVGMVGGSNGTAIVVSGSEDRTIRFWDPTEGKQLFQVSGLIARSLATTPPNAKRSLIAAGLENGSVHLAELKKAADGQIQIVQLPDAPDCHSRSVTCVAFSPEGDIVATGGEDLAICLWKVGADGKLTLIEKKKSTHKSALTYLHYAEKERLVSAGRDKAIHVWNTAGGKIAIVAGEEFGGRSGDVSQPGVSPDGKYLIYDQGKELKIMSLADRHLAGSILNITGSLPFTGAALFAPDGRTVLTNCAGENRVELWRAPLGGRRSSELRQFVWTAGQSTCAAFMPDSRYVVTGTTDHQVLVWEMPESQEVDQKDLTATISLVENFIDSTNRQVRIWAELDTPNPGWLVPGGTATLVIEPGKLVPLSRKTPTNGPSSVNNALVRTVNKP